MTTVPRVDAAKKKRIALARERGGKLAATEARAAVTEARAFAYEPFIAEISLLADGIEDCVRVAEARPGGGTAMRWTALQNVLSAARALHAAFHTRDRGWLYGAARLIGAAEAQLAMDAQTSARTARGLGVPKKSGQTKAGAIRRIASSAPGISGGEAADRMSVSGDSIDPRYARKVLREHRKKAGGN